MTPKQKYIIVGFVVLLVLGALGFYVKTKPSGPVVKVLFLGNSFTSVNDLPKMLHDLAASLGDNALTDSYSPGGYKLSQHIQDQNSLNKIQSRPWDFVVLQDQSQLPSFVPEQVAQEVTPFALALNEHIHVAHVTTKTVFYETWGYKDGDTMNCPGDKEVCDYAGMQTRLIQTYQALATQTGAVLAPVGQAWQVARAQHPEIELYAADGKHPSLQGTYLAACVFYVTLFHKPAVGAASLGLSKAEASALQQVAGQVMGN